MPKKTKRKHKETTGPLYVSPDGGHTIYEQKANGEKVLIEQDDFAKDQEEIVEDEEMIGQDALDLRRKYPALKKAWENYKTIFKMVAND